MKKTYLISVLCLAVNFTLVKAQQSFQYTQFMHFKLGYNPAYAGSNEAPNITTLIRNQWLGIDGAPETQLLSFEMPLFNQKVGAGASIIRNSVGILNQYTLETSYAYRFRLGRGHLGIGLSASVRYMNADFSELSGTQSIDIDEAIPTSLQSKFVPNFGTGLYYDGQKFYIGLSAPRLITNNIDFGDSETIISREVNHIYMMSGFLFDLNDNLQLQPQILLKYVKGAPFDADVNVTLHVDDKFYGGLAYRLGGSKSIGFGESLSLLLGANLSKNVLFGITYDLTLSDLRDYNSGSIEAAFKYTFGDFGDNPNGEDIQSPRDFF